MKKREASCQSLHTSSSEMQRAAPLLGSIGGRLLDESCLSKALGAHRKYIHIHTNT